MMGLQFENLVLNNLKLILLKLQIDPNIVISAFPFNQKANSKNKGGCQIDLLIETRDQVFYICEIKSGKRVGKEVLSEIQKKAKVFKRPKYSSLKKVLIFAGEVEDSVLESEDLFYCLSFSALLQAENQIAWS